MGFWKFTNQLFGVRRFCGQVCGRMVEVRVGSWGRRSIFVDGDLVVDRPFSLIPGLADRTVVITTPDGVIRKAEVRLVDTSGRPGPDLYVEVVLDGQTTVRIDEVGRAPKVGMCSKCGYVLAGLELDNGMVTCPECGDINKIVS